MLKFSDHTSNTLKERMSFLDKEVKASYPIEEFFAKGIKNHTCIDLGANIGCFARYAALFFSKVWAFEASHSNFDLTKRILTINNIGNVEIFNLAAWSESGKELKITKPKFAAGDFSGDASLVYEPKNEEFENVTTISLEDIFKLVKTDYIDYLKIDIEGSEYETLLNKDLSNIGVIVGEIHMHPTIPFNEAREMLMQHIRKYFNVLWEAPNNFIAISKEIKAK